jgi:hypothetical protein
VHGMPKEAGWQRKRRPIPLLEFLRYVVLAFRSAPWPSAMWSLRLRPVLWCIPRAAKLTPWGSLTTSSWRCLGMTSFTARPEWPRWRLSRRSARSRPSDVSAERNPGMQNVSVLYTCLCTSRWIVATMNKTM